MEQTMIFIKKNGALGCMLVAIMWLNSRLNIVEERLYDCYEERITPSQVHVGNSKKHIKVVHLFATLQFHKEHENNRKNKSKIV